MRITEIFHSLQGSRFTIFNRSDLLLQILDHSLRFFHVIFGVRGHALLGECAGEAALAPEAQETAYGFRGLHPGLQGCRCR